MMATRGELLQMGASLALAAGARTAAGETSQKTLLILGGTGFIGPHLTEEAKRRGWQVTHFNRGKSAAQGVPGVETLIGDRNGQLDALRGRQWNAMVDDTGFVPKFVKQSAQLLAPEVDYCLFISSISVYASMAKPNDEDAPTLTLDDPDVTEVTPDSYGGMKALCERYSQEAFGKRISIVRPGYIVGPLDKSDRFTYWPVRASKGGEMLVPGTPRDPIQIIDVRDLAYWMMTLVETRTPGRFNAVSRPGAFRLGGLIDACARAAPYAGTRFTWVPENFLAAHWKPEELDLPPWSPPSGDTAAAGLVPSQRAVRAGLRSRPLADTVRDTLVWFQSLPPERQAKLHAGLDATLESQTLTAWHSTRHSNSA
jgi:2'-hydroxyisoflavone reductase